MILGIADFAVIAQAAAAALFGTAIAAALVRGLPLKSSGRPTVFAWCLLVAPAAVPSLMVGYAYSPFLLPLVHHPFWQSAAYAFLVAAKTVPALTLALALLPHPISHSAGHALTLAPHSQSWSYRFLVRAHAPRIALTFSLGFILALNEFEIAALLGVPSWSVAVFDAHAGGLPASESIQLALSTLAIQLPVLLVAIIAFKVTLGRSNKYPSRSTKRPGPAVRRTAWLLLLFVSSTTALAPFAIILAESAGGLSVAVSRFPLGREIFASIYLAAAASCLVLFASGRLVSHRTFAVAVAIPCLTGSLLIGLSILSLFQWAPLSELRSGPVPAIVALTLTTLPAAIALQILAAAARRKSLAHAARLSLSPTLRWRYLTTPTAGIMSLVFLWTYFDVAIPSLLSPPGMTTAFERLHNLMHYGRTTALSAMVVTAFLFPVLVIAATWTIARLGFLLLSRRDRGTVNPPGPPPSAPNDA